jgi:hypothetical protein
VISSGLGGAVRWVHGFLKDQTFGFEQILIHSCNF